jgi:hypothetical protein
MEMETTTATLDETKDMIVVKRSGKREAVSFDKILSRVKKIGDSIPKQKGETGGGSDGKVSEYRKSDIAWIKRKLD